MLSGDVQATIRAEVVAAGGAEVLFLGRVDARGVVVEVEVAARGHDGAVLARVARAREHDVALHNHPSGVLLPSDADLAVASELAEHGTGSVIVSNDAARCYVVVPPRPARPRVVVGAAEVEAVLAPGGPVARQLGPGHEPRPGQRDMALAVGRALAEDRVALLEAGTGTGKTFAYLAPAALHALRNGERVVVSTATIHLQEQVTAKDAPLLARALRAHDPALPPLQVAVMKGRSNYVSLRRAAEAAAQDPSAFGSDDERREVEALAAWAQETRTGDKAELSPPPSGDAWEHVSSQADNCLRAQCPRFGECHYFAARRHVSRAHVVVVNHHLLLSDVAIKEQAGPGQGVLPPFERLVVDEAHHLEAIAGERLGDQVSELGVERSLGRLQRRRDARRGLLPSLRSTLSRGGAHGFPLARAVDDELLPQRDRAHHALLRGFDEVARLVRARLPEAERGLREARLRVRAGDEPLVAPLVEAGRELAVLAGRLGALGADVQQLPEGDLRARVEPQVREAEAVGKRLARAAKALDGWRDLGPGGGGGGGGGEESGTGTGRSDPGAQAPGATAGTGRSDPDAQATRATAGTGRSDPGGQAPGATAGTGTGTGTGRSDLGAQAPGATAGTGRSDLGTQAPGHADPGPASGHAGATGRATTPAGETVRWIELTRGRDGRDVVTLVAAPLEVGPRLRRVLFDPLRTAVLSSATLTVAGRFDYLATQVGLADLGPERRDDRRIPSPFDYPRQAVLGVPDDVPLPDAAGHEPAAHAVMRALVLASRGRAFLLFTSYAALRRAFDALEPPLRAAGLVPLRQGEQSRRHLLEAFRETPGAVLFGTDSFWEGVDVPGQALVLVVIAKLPFRVPSEPLQEARAEAVTRRGGDPFRALMLPQAVLKLTQGFGRLIRTRTDRGAVVVLDRRLVTRAYGRDFLDSLPPARVLVAPTARLVEAVRPFVDAPRGPG